MKKLTSALFLMIFATAGYISNANSMDFSFNIGAAANHAGFYGEGTEKISDTDDSSDGWRTLDDTEAGAFVDTHSSLFVEIGLGEYIDIGVEHILGDINTPENVNVQHQGGTEYQLAGTKKTNKVKASFQEYYTLYTNINVPLAFITDGLKFYLKGGFSVADIATQENLETGGAYPNVSSDGLMAGFGFHHDFDAGFFTRLEVTATEWEDVSAFSTAHGAVSGSVTDSKKVEVTDMMSASASFRIGKKF